MTHGAYEQSSYAWFRGLTHPLEADFNAIKQVTASGLRLSTAVQPAAGFLVPAVPTRSSSHSAPGRNCTVLPGDTPGLSRGLRDVGLGGGHESGKPSLSLVAD